jgi:hypothetical protein
MVRQLSSTPGFGFETAHVNAHAFYRVGSPKLGVADESTCERISNTANLMKKLGYVPLLSIYIGIDRIRLAVKNDLSYKINHIVRGIIEVLCLGLLLLPVDLIITAYRDHKAKQEPETPSGTEIAIGFGGRMLGDEIKFY